VIEALRWKTPPTGDASIAGHRESSIRLVLALVPEASRHTIAAGRGHRSAIPKASQ